LPDYSTTYPPHCLRGTRGARKIAATEQQEPVPITLELLPEHYLSGREFLLLKKNFDVFTNPNTDRLLDHLGPDEIVVFGVATDVCNDAAIRAFLERGRKVRFVEDAARGLDEDRVTACTSAWRDAGVEFTTAEKVISALPG
jgi:nicotinamidase/pyrazinamidase